MFSYIFLWAVVITGDGVVFTCGYTIIFRILFKRFWWQKEFKKAYEFKIEPNGITISLQNNPFESLKKFFNDITGQNKTIDEKIDDSVNSYINDTIVNRIAENNGLDDIDKKIDDLIIKSIKKKINAKLDLGEQNGKIPKKEN